MAIYFDLKTIREITGDKYYRQPREFTLEELSQYDGSNGKPAYIAVEDIVYDVSNDKTWAGGTHFGLVAGKDNTAEFNSCHGNNKILRKLPRVGILNANTGMSGGANPGMKTGMSGGVNSGMNTGMSGGTNTGMNTGMSGGTNPGMNTGMSGGTNPGMNTGMGGGTNPGMNTGMSGGTNPGMKTGMSGGINPGMNTGMSGGTNPGMNTGMSGGTNPGMSGGTNPGMNTGMSGGTSSGMNTGMSGGTNAAMKNKSKFTPDDWIRYITPLVNSALAKAKEGINKEHLYQEFILLGVLVGLGKTPQEAIEQVELWKKTGESQLLLKSKMKRGYYY